MVRGVPAVLLLCASSAPAADPEAAAQGDDDVSIVAEASSASCR
jgi:predicted ATP-grasp superfamily ATP-dependent carboligase